MVQFHSVAIRRANPADAGELAKVEAIAQTAVQESWQAQTDWQERFMAKGLFTYLCEDTQPFGFVTSSDPIEEYFRDGDTGEILGLCLHPDYWGSGFGKKLLVHGVTVLKRRGFERAIIWIPDFAQRAIATAASLQFEQLDGSRVTNHDGGSLSEYCYGLDLTGYF